jgi:hypothetical protein
MGLDMYLTKKTYVKNWNHKNDKHSVSVKLNGKKRKDIQTERVSEIVEDVMYWRKANHIHNWFVSNCQGGVDECQEARVSLDQLKELSELCKKVVDEKDPSLMETVQGFFFGSTDYDQYYYDMCTETHEVIENLLKELEDNPEKAFNPTFYYQSSW